MKVCGKNVEERGHPLFLLFTPDSGLYAFGTGNLGNPGILDTHFFPRDGALRFNGLTANSWTALKNAQNIGCPGFQDFQINPDAAMSGLYASRELLRNAHPA